MFPPRPPPPSTRGAPNVVRHDGARAFAPRPMRCCRFAAPAPLLPPGPHCRRRLAMAPLVRPARRRRQQQQRRQRRIALQGFDEGVARTGAESTRQAGRGGRRHWAWGVGLREAVDKPAQRQAVQQAMARPGPPKTGGGGRRRAPRAPRSRRPRPRCRRGSRIAGLTCPAARVCACVCVCARARASGWVPGPTVWVGGGGGGWVSVGGWVGSCRSGCVGAWS